MATEYAYDITLSKDKKHLTLTVELPIRELAREPILECNDTNAIDIVRRDGFGNFDLAKSGGTLSNWVSRDGNGGNTSGTWIFEKIQPKKTTAKKTTAKKTTKKTTTTS